MCPPKCKVLRILDYEFYIVNNILVIINTIGKGKNDSELFCNNNTMDRY